MSERGVREEGYKICPWGSAFLGMLTRVQFLSPSHREQTY